MSDLFAEAYERVGNHLSAIEAVIKPGVRVTLCVRRPGAPDQDFLMSDDDLDEAIALIRRRKEVAPVVAGRSVPQ